MTNRLNIAASEKHIFFGFITRVAELSVIFIDQCKVLINVPIGSTPFLFQACRMILGTKSRNSWRAAAVLSIPVIAIEMTGLRGSSVSKSSVSILREGSCVSNVVRERANWFAASHMSDARSWRHSWHSSISGMAYRLSSDPTSH